MKTIWSFLCVFIFLSISSAAHARIEGSLVGVKTIDLIVEDLSDDAGRCLITTDALEAAVRVPISNSRIRMRKSDDLPYLYVNVAVLSDESKHCVVAYSLSFRKYVEKEHSIGQFWHKGGVASGPSHRVSRGVINEIEGDTKIFISEWLKAN